jgi:hypothetical protein
MTTQPVMTLVCNAIQIVLIAQGLQPLALIATPTGICIKVLVLKFAQFKRLPTLPANNANPVTITVMFAISHLPTVQFAIEPVPMFPTSKQGHRVWCSVDLDIFPMTIMEWVQMFAQDVKLSVKFVMSVQPIAQSVIPDTFF